MLLIVSTYLFKLHKLLNEYLKSTNHYSEIVGLRKQLELIGCKNIFAKEIMFDNTIFEFKKEKRFNYFIT